MPAASVLTVITSWPTMVYTVLLGVVLIYWLLALLGMVDFESSGIDVDIDTHADASPEDLGTLASYVVAMGLNGVPFSIAISLLVLVGWLFTALASVLVLPLVPTAPLHALAGGVVLALAAALSIIVTARLVRPLRGLFVTHTAQTNAALVGQVCRILTGTVDERQGRAEVAQRGASINIRVWAPSPNPFKRGDRALVTDYDAATLRYRVDVLPIDE
ncbi:ubiquinone biosynthesis protein [Ottowia testudinis]|uniref:Ubiquinone biosynthesis protein n=1 Tax=Ottowia testudinis TaxID=2816950 RepID=A0A975CHI4_9BURK|nr:ubiquinone biosynthesis protein [Ottowia testudinis]QTD45191.1 ubiquinone biosynthesis protein [Ottowia testudinis]